MDIEIKKEADRLMQIEGDVRGEILRTTFTYIERKEGIKGAKRIEEALSELGYPLSYKEIDPLKWYKEAYSVVIYLLCINLFGWEEEEITRMGENAPKSAALLIIFFRQFISLRSIFRDSSKHWRKHLNFGKLTPLDFDEDCKTLSFRLEGYKFHPITDYYLPGYFKGILRLCVKSKELSIVQNKSVYKGDSHNEYTATWK